MVWAFAKYLLTWTVWPAEVISTVSWMSFMPWVQVHGVCFQLSSMLQSPGWLSEKVFLSVFGVAPPLMMSEASRFRVKEGELKAPWKLLERLALVVSNVGRLKLNGRVVSFPSWLNLKKNPSPTVVMLLVSKLQAGRLIREPSLLNSPKNELHTVVILLVLKLHSGKLVRAPS